MHCADETGMFQHSLMTRYDVHLKLSSIKKLSAGSVGAVDCESQVVYANCTFLFGFSSSQLEVGANERNTTKQAKTVAPRSWLAVVVERKTSQVGNHTSRRCVCERAI